MASTLKSWLETRGLEVLLPSLNAEDINDPEDLDGCGEKDLDIFLSSVKLSLGKKAVFRKAVASKEFVPEGSGTPTIAEIKRSIVAMKGVPKYAGGNISEAAYNGAWHDVVRLIEAGADLRATFDYGAPALHHLACCPNLQPDLKQVPLPANLLMRLLLMGDADPNQGDDGNKGALHLWGKYGGSLEQGKVLVEFGADVNKEMNGGYTPLWYVRHYKYPGGSDTDLWEQAAAMLVEQGAVQKPKHL